MRTEPIKGTRNKEQKKWKQKVNDRTIREETDKGRHTLSLPLRSPPLSPSSPLPFRLLPLSSPPSILHLVSPGSLGASLRIRTLPLPTSSSTASSYLEGPSGRLQILHIPANKVPSLPCKVLIHLSRGKNHNTIKSTTRSEFK